MSVRFDAASDRCTWAGTAPTPSSGLTITYWAYLSVDRDDFSSMIRLHSSSGATTNLNVATGPSGVTPCIFTVGGDSVGPQELPVAGWARVAVTVTGSASRIYIATGSAGATLSQDGTVGANAGVAPDSGYTVGGRSAVDGSEWYNGRLRYLRIWSTVLTQSDIEAEWASPTPVHGALLFADYPLADAADLLDHSGNARHLTAGSTSVTTEDDPPVSVTDTATVAADLPPLSTGATGGVVAGGQITTTLPPLDATAGGMSSTAGQLGAALTVPEWVIAATVQTAGQLGAALPALDTELAGALLVAGTTDTALPGPEMALAGAASAPVAGTLAATLPALTMASGHTAWPPAVTADPSVASVAVDGPHDVPWVAVT